MLVYEITTPSTLACGLASCQDDGEKAVIVDGHHTMAILGHIIMGLDCSKADCVSSSKSQPHKIQPQTVLLQPASDALGLTPDVVKEVQRSWVVIKINHNLDDFGEQYFIRLYQQYPEIEVMFPNNPRRQGRMVIALLELSVATLVDIHSVHERIFDIGKQHAQYGAKPEHYDMLLLPLLESLEQGMENAGEEMSPTVRDGWITLYQYVADIMQKGSNKSSE